MIEYDVEAPPRWNDHLTPEDRQTIQAHLHAIAKIAGTGLDSRDYIGWFRYIPNSGEGQESLHIRWERADGFFAWESGKVYRNKAFGGPQLTRIPDYEDRDIPFSR